MAQVNAQMQLNSPDIVQQEVALKRAQNTLGLREAKFRGSMLDKFESGNVPAGYVPDGKGGYIYDPNKYKAAREISISGHNDSQVDSLHKLATESQDHPPQQPIAPRPLTNDLSSLKIKKSEDDNEENDMSIY